MAKLNPYEVYQKYLALRTHFSSTNYDFFKYNGHVKSMNTPEQFKLRRDVFYFKKLAKHPNPLHLMVANFITNPNAWIGDLVTEEAAQKYNAWRKRVQSMTYTFNEDLKNISTDLNTALKVTKGSHPLLLNLYLGEKISLETLIILVDIARCYSYWDRELKDDLVWTEVSRRIVKYRSFLQYDKDKYRELILAYFQNKT